MIVKTKTSTEIFSNESTSRRLYATDASVYQELPDAVFWPKNKDDCVTIIKQLSIKKAPVIPRAAGTSIAGQCVGNGSVIDVSRFMVNISGSPVDSLIRVQPGVILDDLNDVINDLGLKFAIDISTSNRCMIGGMIGNNAAGSHSILYGTTRDHIYELETILSDGSVAIFGPLNNDELEAKKHLQNLEGKIYRILYQIVDENRHLILEKYPKPEIIRRNTGYPLDYLANMQPWNSAGAFFNLAPFLCGTEGTLAFTTQAKLKLVSTPKHKIVVCIHFNDLNEAMTSVSLILKEKPASIELMDKRTLDLSKENIEQQRNRFWIDGEPVAVLVTEFFSDTLMGVEKKAKQLIFRLEEVGSAYSYPVVNQVDISKVWSVRKAGLGLLMGMKSKQKPVAVIEDTAVSIVDLPHYIKDIQHLMAKFEVQCVYYGHVSVGLVHLRPELDLENISDRKKFTKIAQEVADLIKKYHGSLSGEHGDGRVRGPFLKQMFGEEVYKFHQQIKDTFDPDNIFNPGKILANKPIDIDLRVDSVSAAPKKTGFDWSNELSLNDALKKCNGTSACRKSSGRGVMCPSYHASKEEQFSTRGRANLLRFAFSAHDLSQELKNDGLIETMKLCLSCKACKSECPSNVDMSRLKAEYLYQKYQRHGIPLKVQLVKFYPVYLRIASIFPVLINTLQRTKSFRSMIGGSLRLLPEISNVNLVQWLEKKEKKKSGKPVILLIDIFSHYLEPDVVKAAIQVLEKTGHNVTCILMKDSPRQLISNGLLSDAKTSLQRLISELRKYPKQSIIGIEPAEFLTLKDEAPELVGSEYALYLSQILGQSQLFDEYLLSYLITEKKNYESFIKQIQQKPCMVHIHTHCHQKSLQKEQSTRKLLELIPNIQVKEMNTGCCGMAGQFGYENPEFSKKVAETSLIPELKKINKQDVVIVSGISCRHQINDVSSNSILFHPIQFIADRL